MCSIQHFIPQIPIVSDRAILQNVTRGTGGLPCSTDCLPITVGPTASTCGPINAVYNVVCRQRGMENWHSMWHGQWYARKCYFAIIPSKETYFEGSTHKIISPQTVGMIQNPWSMLLIISLSKETLTHNKEHMNNIVKQVTLFQHNVTPDKSNMTQFLNSPITAEAIKKAIQKLKCKKAAGVDGISAEFYKYGCDELLSALKLLFNTILTNGENPSGWATGIIHPVYKKGDHGVPDNYRKITVMPCIGKLFESILNNRLSFKNEVCNDNDLYQAGFKCNSRTTDNIFILCAIKLLNRGRDGNLLNIIKSMFSKAECLQGGMLSPKLFTEYLQDISASFDLDQGIPVDTLLMVYLLFADDLVLFSESAEGLQKQLTALYSYASLWHIIVSIPKTKVLIFKERYTTVCGSFHYGDNIIEQAEQYKYKSANNVLKKLFLTLLPKQFLLYVNSPVLWSVNCHPLLSSRYLIAKYFPY